MLIQFSVENYLSIKDKVVLSLLASRDNEHPETMKTGIIQAVFLSCIAMRERTVGILNTSCLLRTISVVNVNIH